MLRKREDRQASAHLGQGVRADPAGVMTIAFSFCLGLPVDAPPEKT
jgi:hypothetical protein